MIKNWPLPTYDKVGEAVPGVKKADHFLHGQLGRLLLSFPKAQHRQQQQEWLEQRMVLCVDVYFSRMLIHPF